MLFRQGLAQAVAAGYMVDIRFVPAAQLAGPPHRGILSDRQPISTAA